MPSDVTVPSTSMPMIMAGLSSILHTLNMWKSPHTTSASRMRSDPMEITGAAMTSPDSTSSVAP